MSRQDSCRSTSKCDEPVSKDGVDDDDVYVDGDKDDCSFTK